MKKDKKVYLDRYAHPICYLATPVRPDTKIIVCIPCYKEPDLISSLATLAQCTAPKNASVEVIICLNVRENDAEAVFETNAQTAKDFDAFNASHQSNWLSFFLIQPAPFKKKHGGVGLARKIAMDEAVRRFESIDHDGILACFDADSGCQPNYFTALLSHFENHPQSPACTIHFEHPLQGPEDPEIYVGITHYELFLRYYVNALKYANYPNAHQAIGSSMAAKSRAYQKQGGMNKKKAGEDFYFINKMILLGNYTEIKSTCIFPSPRVSDRVPFGTGKAMQDWLHESRFTTYDFRIFEQLNVFMQHYSDFRDQTQYATTVSILSEPIQDFLEQDNFAEALEKINSNTNSLATFKVAFFRYLDCFKIMKLVHFCRDHYYPEKDIVTEAETLLCRLLEKKPTRADATALLEAFRHFDKTN